MPLFVHFFAQLQLENTLFIVLWRKVKQQQNIFLFLNLDMVPWNSTSGGFAYL